MFALAKVQKESEWNQQLNGEHGVWTEATIEMAGNREESNSPTQIQVLHKHSACNKKNKSDCWERVASVRKSKHEIKSEHWKRKNNELFFHISEHKI